MKGKLFKSLLVVSGLLIAAGYAVAVYVHSTKQQAISPDSKNIGGFADRAGALNLSNPRILVGWVRNVFAARVTKESGSVPESDLPGLPHIQYEAEVIYDIKGNASGTITLDFDVTHGGKPLLPGSTYLFATRPWREPGWYYIANDPAGVTLVSNDATRTTVQVLELVLKNDRTYELLNAYPNEILYGNDVMHNDTANSFQSLSDQEKQTVYGKFQELIPPRPVPETLPQPSFPTSTMRKPGATFQEGTNYSTCHDNLDEDANGLIDCADPACASFCPSQAAPPPAPAAPPPAPSSTEEINPPVISAVKTVAASSSVAITWTTNKPATSQLLFGSSTAMSAHVPGNANFSTNHSIEISGLVPGTTYYYEAQSTDLSGKVGSSAQESFISTAFSTAGN